MTDVLIKLIKDLAYQALASKEPEQRNALQDILWLISEEERGENIRVSHYKQFLRFKYA